MTCVCAPFSDSSNANGCVTPLRSTPLRSTSYFFHWLSSDTSSVVRANLSVLKMLSVSLSVNLPSLSCILSRLLPASLNLIFSPPSSPITQKRAFLEPERSSPVTSSYEKPASPCGPGTYSTLVQNSQWFSGSMNSS